MQASNKVALFIDIENIMYGPPSQLRGLDPMSLVAGIAGRLKTLDLNPQFLAKRAYTSVIRLQRSRNWLLGLREGAVEVVHVVAAENAEKNAADVHLAVDCLNFVVHHPETEVVVLISGDGALVPLVQILQSAGKFVVVGGLDGTVSTLLMNVADHFFLLAPAVVPAASRKEQQGRPTKAVIAENTNSAPSPVLRDGTRDEWKRVVTSHVDEALGDHDAVGSQRVKQFLKREHRALVEEVLKSLTFRNALRLALPESRYHFDRKSPPNFAISLISGSSSETEDETGGIGTELGGGDAASDGLVLRGGLRSSRFDVEIPEAEDSGDSFESDEGDLVTIDSVSIA